MKPYMYPASRKKMFTNREHLRSEIKINLDQLEKGKGKHLCFVGLRKIGKTELLKYSLSEQKGSRIAIYLDFEEAGLTPETFAKYYYCMTAYWTLTGAEVDPLKYFDLNFVIREAIKNDEKTIADIGLALTAELEKIKIDQRYLLELAFGMPEQIAHEKKTFLIVYIDEFQEILQLNKFRQIQNILALFRANLQKQNRIRYLTAGSATRVLENIISNGSSPIFGHFTLRYVEPFTKEDTFEFISKLLNFLTDMDKQILYKLTAGHPYYIYSLCNRLEIMYERYGRLDDMVKKAFVLEVCSKDGDINKHCNYIFSISLAKARGYASLRTILLELAQKDGLTLSEISRMIKRNTGEMLSYLNNLINVDMIIKRDKKYYFKDQVLRYWLQMFRLGIEPMLPTDKVINELVSELEEKYQRTSTELGFAKQSEIQDVIERFNAQKVNGDLFGTNGTVELPKFEKVENYSSEDGQVEIDLVCTNNETWFVEIKWKNRSAGVKDIRQFYTKVKDRSEKNDVNEVHRLWFISKSGFTRAALEFSYVNNIFVSSKRELESIEAILR